MAFILPLRRIYLIIWFLFFYSIASLLSETNPQPRKHTLWQATNDFTGDQVVMFRYITAACWTIAIPAANISLDNIRGVSTENSIHTCFPLLAFKWCTISFSCVSIFVCSYTLCSVHLIFTRWCKCVHIFGGFLMLIFLFYLCGIQFNLLKEIKIMCLLHETRIYICDIRMNQTTERDTLYLSFVFLINPMRNSSGALFRSKHNVCVQIINLLDNTLKLALSAAHDRLRQPADPIHPFFKYHTHS